MTSSRKIALLLAMIVASTTTTLRSEDEKKPAAEPSQTTSTATAAAEDSNAAKEAEAKALQDALALERINQFFPIGRSFYGVKIPNYNDDTLTSIMTASKMLHLDEDHIDLDDLHITTYEANGEASTFIEMEKALYNTVNDTLVSETPTRVWQDQFEMKGDYMIYDKKAGTVIMKRNRDRQVETIIYGAGNGIPSLTPTSSAKGNL